MGSASNLNKASRKTDKALRPDVLLPVETLVDLLRLLTRDELEGSHLVNRKFTRASKAIFKSGDVPPRKIERIMVTNWKPNDDTVQENVLCTHAKRSKTDRGLPSMLYWKLAMERLAQVMRFSVVERVEVIAEDEMSLWGITSEIWHGFLHAFRDVAVDNLLFSYINFCPLTAAEMDGLKTLNIRTELFLCSCHLLSKQITDRFLLNLSKMGLPRMKLDGCVPVDKATFEASDDGALALCFPDEHSGQAEDVPLQVYISRLSLTGEFYGKFSQKCHEAPKDRPTVKCWISPIPAEAEPQIMALGPNLRVDNDGDIGFFFHGTGSTFSLIRSNVPQTMMCKSG